MTITTDEQYKRALAEIDNIWDAKSGTPEAARFEELATLVEAYEEKHYPIPPPDNERHSQ